MVAASAAAYGETVAGWGWMVGCRVDENTQRQKQIPSLSLRNDNKGSVADDNKGGVANDTNTKGSCA